MARKTPAELAEARKAAAEVRRVAAEKQAEAARAQAEEEARLRREAEEYKEWLVEAWEKHRELISVAAGIYDELDKLNRKWPNQLVTPRTVARTNKLLGQIRELLEGEEDGFFDDVEDIVPAGDLPETRDVVMILREAKDALDRFGSNHRSEWRKAGLEVAGF